MALNWFAYIGGDIFSTGSYYRIPSGQPEICLNGCVICAIKLDDNSETYPFDIGGVHDFLINAIATQVAQPPFPAVPYVVMKECN